MHIKSNNQQFEREQKGFALPDTFQLAGAKFWLFKNSLSVMLRKFVRLRRMTRTFLSPPLRSTLGGGPIMVGLYLLTVEN